MKVCTINYKAAHFIVVEQCALVTVDTTEKFAMREDFGLDDDTA